VAVFTAAEAHHALKKKQLGAYSRLQHGSSKTTIKIHIIVQIPTARERSHITHVYHFRSDYQADVCWQILNTIKQTSVGKSQILSSRRRDVTQATLIFRKTMLHNTMILNSV